MSIASLPVLGAPIARRSRVVAALLAGALGVVAAWAQPSAPPKLDSATVAVADPGAVAPPAAIAGSPSPPARLDPNDVEAFVDGFMASYLEDKAIVGGVVAVVEHGRVVLAKGYGEADREGHRQVDPQRTLFRVGSISKLFVWIAVMQLVDRGQLDLDADVNTYLDSVQIPATFEQPITLAHLMTHTAGFEDRVLGLFARDAAAVRPLETLLAEEMPVRVRPPGVLASYSNHGTALAMLIVEQVSGVPWIEYLETRVLEPLRLGHTTFRQPVPETWLDDLAVGYRPLDSGPDG
jgi:CubicO group peptidase (beta-lactamase class C family)